MNLDTVLMGDNRIVNDAGNLLVAEVQLAGQRVRNAGPFILIKHPIGHRRLNQQTGKRFRPFMITLRGNSLIG